jgi:hypothetical protein
MRRGDPALEFSSSPFLRVTSSLALRAGVISAMLLAAGCGGGRANVAGKVSYKGKLLATGTVSMVGPDGIVRQGAINVDGTYTVTGLAAGNVQIGVLSPRPVGDVRTGQRGGRGNRLAPPVDGAPDTSGWFAIPSTYQEPTTSGLSAVLASGSNQHDIKLE